MNRAVIAWMYSLAGEARGEALAILTSPAIRTAILWLGPFVGVVIGLDLAAHYGDATGAALPAQFFISQDHSLGECFEYALTGSSALMLFAMWRRLGQTAYLANALLMVWLTLDNIMEFHEAFGHWVAPFISLPAHSPVHANDIGEMLFFGMIGGFWLIGLASAVLGAQARAAVRSIYIACGIGCAAVFGVIVDIMVTWGPHTLAQTNFQAWLEDGGEFAFLNLTFLMVVAFFHVERMAWRRQAETAASPAAV